MFKKLFGNKAPQEETIYSPVTGKVVPIENVPDPVFAQKMMGDGIAVEPADGRIVSPVDGEVIQVFPTKHAIGIRSKGGLEILIHIGIDTVNMQGEGFQTHVAEGDRVTVGQPLLDVSLDLVKEKAASTITPVILTNADRIESVQAETVTDAKMAETPLLKVKLKS